MANSWGESGTTWSQGNWGEQNNFTLPLETSLLTTGSLGTPAAYSEQGWGRATWGNEPWGDSYDPVISVTGYSITAALGTLPYAQSEEGWGRDAWGQNNWGENTTTVALTSSFEMTAGFGPDGWGASKWGEDVSWGGDLSLTTTQLSIAALTGIEATASLGTATISRLDMIFDLTTSLQMSAGLGVLNINDGADHSQGVGSLLATGSVGSLSHEMAYDLTGLSSTMTLNGAGLTIDDTQLITLTTSLLTTGSLGSVTVDDMSVGLSGLQATGSVGTITPADMVIGLSGLSMTGTLGVAGLSVLGYKDIDITGNTSYTYVDHAG
tara:strand:- start:1523 stop:2491 length:969 start_codon:yes stop_codon:yes gene_type:complete